ncbi:MAG: hypothetical protein ACLGJB_25450 [Blastocatellia bacterium]
MGVLSLHNEGPPLEFGNDTKAICQGMAVGEEATSALLKSLADCLNALAAMDDTVGHIVNIWGAGPPPGAMPPNGADASHGPPTNGASQHGGPDVRQSFLRSYEALAPTVDRIDLALHKYRALNAYARSAAEAGRGIEFQAALTRNAGCDFETLVNRRIELLRRLKVRIKVLKNFQAAGVRMLETFDFPEFFLVFMQPIRDVAISVNELYSEVVRSALASHQTLFQVSRLQGEDIDTRATDIASKIGAQAAGAIATGD